MKCKNYIDIGYDTENTEQMMKCMKNFITVVNTNENRKIIYYEQNIFNSDFNFLPFFAPC